VKEDFLGVVEAKRFLGREFLTWLLYRLEEEGGRLVIGGDVVELALGDRVVLQEQGDNQARLTLVDAGDMRSEVGAGLRRGKLVDRARLSVTHMERRWELTLDGGLLTYDSLRCPKLGERDAGLADDPRAALENDLFLRLADVEQVVAFLDRLFAAFCELRASSRWEAETVPALRRWIADLDARAA
jgi:recombination associated protein RdgC